MKKSIIDSTKVENFRSQFRGEVILPGDASYDEQRKIWNGMFDKRPAIIARCITTNDVINSVNFARKNSLLVSVRGGGHNSAGNAVNDDGIVIDLSLMNNVKVDSSNQTVIAEGGALLSDVDKATQEYGLAISSGIVSHTGVGGITLGGGFGWISRKHGLTIDNLISANVITANGEELTASSTENTDLYWGIRGGGGNFGIVTSFKIKCAEIGIEVFSGIICKKFENATEYIRFHRDYVRKMPDEMTIWMVVRHAPPLPFLPESVHGKMVVLIPFVWLGEQSDGEKLIQPVREKTASHGEFMGMNPWTGWQSSFDPLVTHGARNYWKSHHIKSLENDCIDLIVEFAKEMPSNDCEVFIPHMEGSPSRVDENATAFSHRKTPFVLNIHTRWQEKTDDDRCIDWARKFHKSTEKFAKGVYVNFLSDEGQARVRDAYTKEVWDRLVEVKRKYDPENLFRMNQNINPNGSN